MQSPETPAGPILAAASPAMLDVVVAAAHERGGPVVSMELARDDSYDTILKKVDDLHARLVVIGPGNEWLDLTSRSGKVIRRATVPILIARPSPPAGPVIVGIDFSNSAVPAIAAARAEVAGGGRLIAAHVVGAGSIPFVGADPAGAGTAAYDMSLLFESAKKALEQLVAESLPGAEPMVLTGGAGPALVELAGKAEARLVVVGTHSRTGLGRLLVGSTAEAVARGAPCSVLVVPGR